MPRKLNVYQTSQGFYDLVVAAPSMKAALEMWGAGSNLFQQGYAHLATDPKAAAAAMKRPGVVLRRAVGSSGTFAEQAVLPSIEALDSNMAKSPVAPAKVKPAPALKKASTPKMDVKAQQKAAAAFEQERLRKERERAGQARAEAKAAKARQAAIDEAQKELEQAERRHVEIMEAVNADRAAVDRREAAEARRWDEVRARIQDKVRKARDGV